MEKPIRQRCLRPFATDGYFDFDNPNNLKRDLKRKVHESNSSKVEKQVKQPKTIFVSGLSQKVTEEILYELFINAGPVESVTLPIDSQTSKHRDFAFVRFEHQDSVRYSLKLFRDVKLFSVPIRIKEAVVHETRKEQTSKTETQSKTNLLSDDFLLEMEKTFAILRQKASAVNSDTANDDDHIQMLKAPQGDLKSDSLMEANPTEPHLPDTEFFKIESILPTTSLFQGDARSMLYQVNQHQDEQIIQSDWSSECQKPSVPDGIPPSLPGGIPPSLPGVIPPYMTGVIPPYMPGGMPPSMPCVIPASTWSNTPTVNPWAMYDDSAQKEEISEPPVEGQPISTIVTSCHDDQSNSARHRKKSKKVKRSKHNKKESEDDDHSSRREHLSFEECLKEYKRSRGRVMDTTTKSKPIEMSEPSSSSSWTDDGLIVQRTVSPNHYEKDQRYREEYPFLNGRGQDEPKTNQSFFLGGEQKQDSKPRFPTRFGTDADHRVGRQNQDSNPRMSSRFETEVDQRSFGNDRDFNRDPRFPNRFEPDVNRAFGHAAQYYNGETRFTDANPNLFETEANRIGGNVWECERDHNRYQDSLIRPIGFEDYNRSLASAFPNPGLMQFDIGCQDRFQPNIRFGFEQYSDRGSVKDRLGIRDQDKNTFKKKGHRSNWNQQNKNQNNKWNNNKHNLYK